jgi:hypothetical protein
VQGSLLRAERSIKILADLATRLEGATMRAPQGKASDLRVRFFAFFLAHAIACLPLLSCSPSKPPPRYDLAKRPATAGDASDVAAEPAPQASRALPSQQDLAPLPAEPRAPSSAKPASPVPDCPSQTVWDGRVCLTRPCPRGRASAPDNMPILGLGPCTQDGSPNDPPFNRSRATDSLSAVNVVPCARPDAPKGVGHVLVTFLPTGDVGTVAIDGPPFAGTAVGACIAGLFRSVRIAKFRGAPIVVGKSFVLN